MSGERERTPIVIVWDEQPPSPLVHPCRMGLHQWAYLTAGGQECRACGARR